MSISVRILKAQDIPGLTAAFLHTVWKTPEAHFRALLTEQAKGEIVFLIAHTGKEIAGFVYIKWQADYPPFARRGIPEIRDLRVLPEFRRRGVATALIDEAEKRIFQRSPLVGIGVGLYADYGSAQRMYVSRGYVPDGRGIYYKNKQLKPGRDVFVDDNLVLYFTKERPR